MARGEAKKVFVSYVREDMDRVDKLCSVLATAGIPYWRDRESLGPGDQWEQEIRNAIQSDALLFLACFSERSRAKSNSYMNEELTLAAEEYRMRPPGKMWLIPVRFADVDLPEWDLGAGRTLRDLHYVDLFGEDYLIEAFKLAFSILQLTGSRGADAATSHTSIEQAQATIRVQHELIDTKTELNKALKQLLDSRQAEERALKLVLVLRFAIGNCRQ